jgi:hypothetical protein
VYASPPKSPEGLTLIVATPVPELTVALPTELLSIKNSTDPPPGFGATVAVKVTLAAPWQMVGLFGVVIVGADEFQEIVTSPFPVCNPDALDWLVPVL